MSIEIEVCERRRIVADGKTAVQCGLAARCRRKLPWGRYRLCPCRNCGVLVQAESEGVVCHVGIHRREVKWNGRKMRAGGIGGVLTREDQKAPADYATLRSMRRFKH